MASTVNTTAETAGTSLGLCASVHRPRLLYKTSIMGNCLVSATLHRQRATRAGCAVQSRIELAAARGYNLAAVMEGFTQQCTIPVSLLLVTH